MKFVITRLAASPPVCEAARTHQAHGDDDEDSANSDFCHETGRIGNIAAGCRARRRCVSTGAAGAGGEPDGTRARLLARWGSLDEREANQIVIAQSRTITVAAMLTGHFHGLLQRDRLQDCAGEEQSGEVH